MNMNYYITIWKEHMFWFECLLLMIIATLRIKIWICRVSAYDDCTLLKKKIICTNTENTFNDKIVIVNYCLILCFGAVV